MIKRQTITAFGGRIIGYIDVDSSTGNKTVYAFGGRILGYYKAKEDVTVLFGGKIVSHGDTSSALLVTEQK